MAVGLTGTAKTEYSLPIMILDYRDGRMMMGGLGIDMAIINATETPLH